MTLIPVILLFCGCAGWLEALWSTEAWDSPEGTDWVQVAASENNATCGLREDGSGECWGYDADEGMALPDAPLVHMDVGGRPCGLTAAGDVACGDGFGSGAGENVDLGALLDGTQYKDVAVGHDFYCGLSDAGALRCVTTSDIALVAPEEEAFTRISGGAWMLCGLHEDGSASCWDTDGVRTDQTGPFTEVEAGREGACGITGEGAIECWGYVFVEADPGPFAALSMGTAAACALDPDGDMRCWVDEHKLIGVNPPEDGPFSGVAAGTLQVCGLRTDGAISCVEAEYWEE
ncbi:MAG: hypothetical protein JXB39_16225 [Deltaproteobacteria bacterium]|nr:hypothetical protein [Deltaproteobacteria bacterium]